MGSVRGGEVTPAIAWALLLTMVIGIGLSAARREIGMFAVTFLALLNFVIALQFDRFQNECPLEQPRLNGRNLVGAWCDPEAHPSVIIGLGNTDCGPDVTRAQVCQIVERSYRAIAHRDPAREIMLWYPVDDQYGSLFTAISATRYWDISWLSPRFPKIARPDDDLTETPPGRFALLTHDGREGLAAARAAAGRERLKMALRYRESYRDEFGVPVTLEIFDLAFPARPRKPGERNP